MKKFLKLTVITILCFVLVGCGCSKKEKKKEKSKEKEVSLAEKLYTNDSQLVFNNKDVYKLVFYYNSAKEITGYEHYYEFATEKEAEEEYKKVSEDLKNNVSIKKIERKGKFVIYTMNPSEYEGKTVSDIQESYSFLIPVYKD